MFAGRSQRDLTVAYRTATLGLAPANPPVHSVNIDQK
jgi:hypothetical protein